MADRNRDADARELLEALTRIRTTIGNAEATTKRAEAVAARTEASAARVGADVRRVGEYIAPGGGVRRNIGGQPIFEVDRPAPRPARPIAAPAQAYPSAGSGAPQRVGERQLAADRRLVTSAQPSASHPLDERAIRTRSRALREEAKAAVDAAVGHDALVRKLEGQEKAAGTRLRKAQEALPQGYDDNEAQRRQLAIERAQVSLDQAKSRSTAARENQEKLVADAERAAQAEREFRRELQATNELLGHQAPGRRYEARTDPSEASSSRPAASTVSRLGADLEDARKVAAGLEREYGEAQKTQGRLSAAQRRLLATIAHNQGNVEATATTQGYPLQPREVRTAQSLQRRSLVGDVESGRPVATTRGLGVQDPHLIQGDITNQTRYVAELEKKYRREVEETNRALAHRPRQLPSATAVEPLDVQRRIKEAAKGPGAARGVSVTRAQIELAGELAKSVAPASVARLSKQHFGDERAQHIAHFTDRKGATRFLEALAEEAATQRAAIEKKEQAERTTAAQAGAKQRIAAEQRARIIDPAGAQNRLYPQDIGRAPSAPRFLGYPGGPDPRDQRRPIDTTSGASTELARINQLRQEGIRLTAQQTAAQLRHMGVLRSQASLYERLVALDRRRALPPSTFIEGSARDVTPPRPPRQLPPGYVPPRDSRQLPPGRQPPLQLPRAGGTIGGALYGSTFPTGVGVGGRGHAVPNPQRVREYYQELQRAALIQQDASQQMRRHGALTTEFLTALARGETTLAEFRYQIGATIGKFAGWTAAATAVYGVVGALRTLGSGAVDGLSAVQDLSRFVTTGFDPDKATARIGDLSRRYNVSPGTTGEASIGVAKVYKDQDTSLKATEVVLKAVQVAELEAADATKYFAAIGRGASLDIEQLALVLDQINSAQNNIGTSSADAAAGLARATPAFIQAGGSVQTLVELMTTLQAITGESGTTIGTALARTVSRVRRPSNQQVLKEFGIDPNQGIDQIFEQAIAKSGNLTGQQRVRLGGQGLSSPEYGRFFTGLLGDSGRAAFAKAQRYTDPNVARGSADRELEIRLGSVREQLKRLGVELQVIGLQLAQAGVFDALGAGIKTLTLTLQTINEVLKLFNELPGPVKKTAIYLAELAGVLALIRRTGVGQALSERYGLSTLGRSPDDLARRKAVTTSRALSESLTGQRETFANTAREKRLGALSETNRAEALIAGGAPKRDVDEARAAAKAYARAGDAAAEREVLLGESVKRQDAITKGLQKGRLTPAQAAVAYLPGGAPGSGARPVGYPPSAAPVRTPGGIINPAVLAPPPPPPRSPVAAAPRRVGGGLVAGTFTSLNRIAGALPALSVALLGAGGLFLAGSKIVGAIHAEQGKRDRISELPKTASANRDRLAEAREAAARGRTAVQNPYTGAPQRDPRTGGILYDVDKTAQISDKALRDEAARLKAVRAARASGVAATRAYLEEIDSQARTDIKEASTQGALKTAIQKRTVEVYKSVQAQKATDLERQAAQSKFPAERQKLLKQASDLRAEVARAARRLTELARAAPINEGARDPRVAYDSASVEDSQALRARATDTLAARGGARARRPIRSLAAGALAAAYHRNSADPEELADVIKAQDDLVNAVTSVSTELETKLKLAGNSSGRQAAFRQALTQLHRRRQQVGASARQNVKDLAETEKELSASQERLGGYQVRDTYGGRLPAGAGLIRRRLEAEVDKLEAKRDRLLKQVRIDHKTLDAVNARLDAFHKETARAKFNDFAEGIQRKADLRKSTETNDKTNIRTDVAAAKQVYDEAVRSLGPKSDEAVDALIAYNELVKSLKDDVSETAQDFAARVQARGDLRTSTINPNTAAGGVARIGSQLQTAKEVLATLQEHGAKQREINDQIAQINDLQFSLQEAAKQLAERMAQAKFRQKIAGILDPVKRAKTQLRFDRSQLSGKSGVEREEQKAVVREDEVGLRQAIIDEDLSDARFKHDVGKLTDSAYITELKKILRTKKLGKQARQQILTEIYNLKNDAENATELELTPGDAHLPTLTEIRKFIGGKDLKGNSVGGSTPSGQPQVVRSERQVTNRNSFTFHMARGTEMEKVFEALEKAGVHVKTAARSRRPG